MIELNSTIPNIPRFETVNVPPESSSGLSLFSLALPAISLTSKAICSNPFKLVFLILIIIWFVFD